MATLADPIQFSQAWDVIKVSGVTSPGVCKLSGWKRAHEWDVKKGKGTLGGTITFVGRPPAKGSVTIRLWTPQHFQDWATFQELLKFDPSKKTVKSIDIYHPALALINVFQVVTENIGAIEHQGDGLYSVDIDFLEYFPPPKRPAVGTASGSDPHKDPNGPGAQPDPIADAQQKQIAQLLQRAQQP